MFKNRIVFSPWSTHMQVTCNFFIITATLPETEGSVSWLYLVNIFRIDKQWFIVGWSKLQRFSYDEYNLKACLFKAGK